MSPSAPTGQISYIISHGLRGKLFNDYDTASLMEWRLYGRNTFFIDSMNAYGDDILRPWAMTLLGRDQALLDAADVNCVVGRVKDPAEPDYPPLYHLLGQDKDWKLAYAGFDGPIWVRISSTQSAESASTRTVLICDSGHIRP